MTAILNCPLKINLLPMKSVITHRILLIHYMKILILKNSGLGISANKRSYIRIPGGIAEEFDGSIMNPFEPIKVLVEITNGEFILLSKNDLKRFHNMFLFVYLDGVVKVFREDSPVSFMMLVTPSVDVKYIRFSGWNRPNEFFYNCPQNNIFWESLTC